jgi:hypothetical protein
MRCPPFDPGSDLVYTTTMEPNPVLRRLGFEETDRVVVIHADDLGMCHAGLAALPDLYEAGLVSSGSVMVPCPWFAGAVRFAEQHAGVDLGVHITITCEWETYRWAPISTRDPATGLLDADGFFPATAEAVQGGASAVAVSAEIEAQIARAVTAGLQPTHVDTHMGAVAHAKFLESYVTRALAAGLPPMFPRLDEAGWRALTREQAGANLSEEDIRRVVELAHGLEERGVPLMDRITGLPLSSDPTTRREEARAALDDLPPGITHFIIHPARDTPELRAITSDWACRVADYETFARRNLREHVRASGIQVVGYRALQALMPRGGTP